MPTSILGFFLTKVRDPNGIDLYRFACLIPNSPRRIVYLRSSNGRFVAKVGELVKLTPGGTKLIENSWCLFRKFDRPMFINQGDMEFIHRNVLVEDSNCTIDRIFHHPELGEMIDKKQLLTVPGWYQTIMFRIHLTEKTFFIKVLRAFRSPVNPIPSWDAVGMVQLIKFDKNAFFAGVRSVFQLVNEQCIELFEMKISSGATIQLIKVVKNAKGGWEDVPSELQGCVFPIEDHRDKFIVRISGATERLIQVEMKIGEMYRFCAAANAKDDVAYWKHTGKDENLLRILDTHQASDSKIKDNELGNRKLNDTQYNAFIMACNEQRKLVCIQGAPATGKSFTLAQLICHYFDDGRSALVLAPTREALCQLEQLTRETWETFETVEHRDAFMDVWTLDDRMEEAAKGRMEELKGLWNSWEQKRIGDEELRELQRELVERTRLEVMKEICPNVKIVFATINSTFIQAMMDSKMFNPSVCVIDEAHQVLETQVWPACLADQRIVMTGDPHQIPPISFSPGSSILDRVIERKEQFSWIILNKQCSHDPEIIAWSNKTFYDNSLKHGVDDLKLVSIANRRFECWEPYDPMVMFDTSMLKETDELAAKCYETIIDNERDITYFNEGEAEIAIDHMNSLLDVGIKQSDIAIITPYQGQVDLLKKMTHCDVNIGTVDAFQWQRFDVVIFTMVRSNPIRDVGMIADLRRLNVAITRAKRQFCFIANGWMLYNIKNQPELADLLKHFMDSLCKLPPSFARKEYVEFNEKHIPKRNNFGLNFEMFRRHTRDRKMIRYIDGVKKLEIRH